MKKLFLLLSICQLCHANSSFAYCDNISDYSLLTFQFSEQHTKLKIRRIWVAYSLETKKTDLEYAEIDLRSHTKLFHQGYLTLEQLKATEFSVDEAKLNVKTKKSELKSMDGDIDIFGRNVQNTCGRDPLPMEEIIEVAGIYTSKWQDQVNNDIPKVDLSRRRLKMAIRFHDYKKMMFSRGYVSKRELADANYDVIMNERRVGSQNAEIQLKKEFIDQLSVVNNQK